MARHVPAWVPVSPPVPKRGDQLDAESHSDPVADAGSHSDPVPASGPHSDPVAASGPHSDPVAAARTICLNQLTTRPRTRAELEQALSKRGIPDDARAMVLDRLAEVGLIDDRDFAAMFVTARQRGRGLARAELARQLRAKGVDREVVSDAVSVVDDHTEYATAKGLVERKALSMRSLDNGAQARRLIGMLARKGYPSAVSYQVVREVLGELADDRNGTEVGEPDYLAFTGG